MNKKQKNKIQKRRAEIKKNAERGFQDWKDGKVKAYDNLDEFWKEFRNEAISKIAGVWQIKI